MMTPERLKLLMKRALESKSSSFLITHKGKVVESMGELTSPFQTMSMTKSILALGVLFLLKEGKLSLDLPLYKIFPELKQGKKQLLTLSHLLTHTSGIQNEIYTDEIYSSPSFVRLSLAAELVTQPGEFFSYNNKACNLIPEIILRLSGKTCVDYLNEHLFMPLGIEKPFWQQDSSGSYHGLAGAFLSALDLNKIGVWLSTCVRENTFPFTLLTKPVCPLSSKVSLLWWLGKDSIIARGYLGQRLIIDLAREYVIVRQFKKPDGLLSKDAHTLDLFDELEELVS